MGRAKKILFYLLLIFITLVIGLGMGEGVLRLTGFSFHLYPERIEFGWPDPVVMNRAFESDYDLLWVPKGYDRMIVEAQKRRAPMVLLGDSCTQLGRYDYYFIRRFKKEKGKELRLTNLGVAGWSSYQGMRQLQRDAIQLRPKLITIYFGWNDHWIGFGVEDKEAGRAMIFNRMGLSHLRLFQLYTKLQIIKSRANRKNQKNIYRVTRDDFGRNLAEMVNSAKKNNIIPVLLTAPTSHKKGREPKYISKRHLTRLSDLVPLHQDYVQIVRQTADKYGAPLCDLEKDFAKIPVAVRGQKYFSRDGIHLTDDGNEKLAQFLYDCLEKRNLLDRLLPANN